MFIHNNVSLFIKAALLFCICSTPIKSDWFKPTPQPEIPLELKPKKKTSVLYIEHELPGSITLHGWKQDHILVTIHKHTYTTDDADRISVILKQTDNGVITLTIEESEELRKSARVDITVHIPHTIAATITAHNNITIIDANGTIRVQTETGDITTENTRGALHLETEKGSITCSEAHNSIDARTKKGSITINESRHSISAETDNGSIDVTTTQVPSTGRIDLRTQKRGIIKLSLPDSTNAHIVADTTRGMITSDLLITLESHTMVLNNNTYQDLQRHIRGTIGQQATAEIKLSGTRDIHIATTEND